MGAIQKDNKKPAFPNLTKLLDPNSRAGADFAHKASKGISNNPKSLNNGLGSNMAKENAGFMQPKKPKKLGL